MKRTTAIVLAAGESRRMGGDIPKAYLTIAGRSVVLRTLDHIFASPVVNSLVLVVAAGDVERCQALLRADVAMRDRSWLLQIGGATRRESAQRGLQKIPGDTEIVLIHDAARPFASVALIERCIEAAALHGAAVPGLPARDTIKIVSQDRWIQTTPDRRSLWEIQTPQAFKRELIIAAHQQAEKDGVEVTDDATAVERTGAPVFVVDGERVNFKITVPEDVWLAEIMIREGKAS